MPDRNSYSDDDVSQSIDEVIEQFLQEYRSGHQPSVELYAAKHPNLAEQILELFPTLLVMEGELAAAPAAAANYDSSSPRTEASIPRVLGDYQLHRELGRGGMGIVYEAFHKTLKRTVALKTLPFVHKDDAERISRFEQEALAAARLHHTNIVPVFEVGVAEGVHYISMQYVDGISLDQAIHQPDLILHASSRANDHSSRTQSKSQKKPESTTIIDQARSTDSADLGRAKSRSLPLAHIDPVPHQVESLDPQSPFIANTRNSRQGVGIASSSDEKHLFRCIAEIGAAAADALQHVHAQGFIHRDIKPSNLLLDESGRVWVTDFGLAKAHESTEDLTCTGGVVGTLRYVAPERLNGDTSEQSDIYSLGVTMYELLVGKPAYAELDRLKLIKQIAESDPPAARRQNSMVPRDLETIVSKAMSRRAENRYDSASELSADLRRWLRHEPIAARRASIIERSKRWSQRNPLSAALVTILVILSSIGLPIVTWKWLEADRNHRQSAFHLELANHFESVALQRQSEANAQKSIAERSTQQLQDRMFEYFVEVAFHPDLMHENPLTRQLRTVMLTKAEDHYGQFVSNHDAINPLNHLMAQYHLGRIQQNLMKYAMAKQTYELAIESNPIEADSDSNSAEIQHFLAHCYLGLAETEIELGELDSSQINARIALSHFESLKHDRPKSYEAVNDVGLAFRCLGDVERLKGEPTAGQAWYEMETSLREQFEPANPSVGYLDDAADAYQRLARTQRDGGQFAEASASYRSLIQLRTELKQVSPLLESNEAMLADANLGLGTCYRRSGAFEQAESAFESAVQSLQSMYDASPWVIQYREQLGLAYLRLGHLQIDRGKDTEALQNLVSAEELFSDILLDNRAQGPNRQLARESLGPLLRLQGDIQQRLDMLDEAMDSYGGSIELLENHIGLGAFSETSYYELALARQALARFQQQNGQQDRAIENWSASLEDLRAMSGRFTQTRYYDVALSNAHYFLGSLYYSNGDHLNTSDQLGRAAEILERMIRASTRTAEDINKLANCLSVIGIAEHNLDEYQKSIAATEKSIEVRRSLMEARPNEVGIRVSLLGSRVNLGYVLRDAGKIDESIRTLEESFVELEDIRLSSLNAPSASSYAQNCRRQLVNSLIVRSRSLSSSVAPSSDEVEQAIEDATRASQLASESTYQIFETLAMAWLAAGEPEKSKEYLQEAILIAPEDRVEQLRQQLSELDQLLPS